MKAKTILLIAGKTKREFSFEHAENVLKHPSNMYQGKPVWVLPKDSNYEFVNNELRTKTNKGSSGGAKKQKSTE